MVNGTSNPKADWELREPSGSYYGPFTTDQMFQLVNEGRIGEHFYVRHPAHTNAEWIPVSSVKSLSGRIKLLPPVQGQAPPVVQAPPLSQPHFRATQQTGIQKILSGSSVARPRAKKKKPFSIPWHVWSSLLMIGVTIAAAKSKGIPISEIPQRLQQAIFGSVPKPVLSRDSREALKRPEPVRADQITTQQRPTRSVTLVQTPPAPIVYPRIDSADAFVESRGSESMLRLNLTVLNRSDSLLSSVRIYLERRKIGKESPEVVCEQVLRFNSPVLPGEKSKGVVFLRASDLQVDSVESLVDASEFWVSTNRKNWLAVSSE